MVSVLISKLISLLICQIQRIGYLNVCMYIKICNAAYIYLTHITVNIVKVNMKSKLCNMFAVVIFHENNLCGRGILR